MNRNVFLNFALLFCRPVNKLHWGQVPHRFKWSIVYICLFRVYLMQFWFCYDFFYYRHRDLVENTVCYLFFIVLSSSPIILLSALYHGINVFHWLLIERQVCFLKVFYLFILWWAGSEHFVRTHINEPPCYILSFTMKNSPETDFQIHAC